MFIRRLLNNCLLDSLTVYVTCGLYCTRGQCPLLDIMVTGGKGPMLLFVTGTLLAGGRFVGFLDYFQLHHVTLLAQRFGNSEYFLSTVSNRLAERLQSSTYITLVGRQQHSTEYESHRFLMRVPSTALLGPQEFTQSWVKPITICNFEMLLTTLNRKNSRPRSSL